MLAVAIFRQYHLYRYLLNTQTGFKHLSQHVLQKRSFQSRYMISKALQHTLRQMCETSWCAEKLTAKMVFHKGGDNEHWNESEYWANSVTWCMKDGALSASLREDKINYEQNVCMYNIKLMLSPS